MFSTRNNHFNFSDDSWCTYTGFNTNYYLLLSCVLLELRLVLEDIQPTNTGMFVSEVDLISLLGLGVM